MPTKKAPAKKKTVKTRAQVTPKKPETVKILSISFAGRSVSLPHSEEAQGKGAVRFPEDGVVEVDLKQAARLVELFPNDVRVV